WDTPESGTATAGRRSMARMACAGTPDRAASCTAVRPAARRHDARRTPATRGSRPGSAVGAAHGSAPSPQPRRRPQPGGRPPAAGPPPGLRPAAHPSLAEDEPPDQQKSDGDGGHGSDTGHQWTPAKAAVAGLERLEDGTGVTRALLRVD